MEELEELLKRISISKIDTSERYIENEFTPEKEEELSKEILESFYNNYIELDKLNAGFDFETYKKLINIVSGVKRHKEYLEKISHRGDRGEKSIGFKINSGIKLYNDFLEKAEKLINSFSELEINGIEGKRIAFDKLNKKSFKGKGRNKNVIKRGKK